MTVEDALPFFSAVPTVQPKLQTLMDVGLSYVRLGQSATTLSGGEAQRVKLSKELSKRATGRTLYILDEPTTGLHFADIAQLLKVLHRLRDEGNTIIVIEHNLDVIKTADWGDRSGSRGRRRRRPDHCHRHAGADCRGPELLHWFLSEEHPRPVAGKTRPAQARVSAQWQLIRATPLRWVPLVAIVIGVVGGGVYWIAAQFWPTSVAVVLAMLATSLLDARSREGTAAFLVFALLIKYNSLMALSAATAPVPCRSI